MKHSSRARRGFTLAELLIVVAIFGVLLAVAIPGVTAIRKNLRMVELDNCAREIFTVAQNRLIGLQTDGRLDQLPEQTISTMPSDFEASSFGDWDSDSYYYVTQAEAALLVPALSIDETVRAGHYVIEYNKNTAMVYGVFYAAENPFDYNNGPLPREHDARKDNNPMLGYYGGSGVNRGEINQSELPDVKLVNNDQLRVELTSVPTSSATVTYTITVAQRDAPEKQAQVTFQNTQTGPSAGPLSDPLSKALTYSNGTYTLLLDSLDGGKQCKDTVPDITPGADLIITVTAVENGKLPGRVQKLTNSLFLSRNENTARVAYSRHLQNLDPAFSSLPEDLAEKQAIKAAVQTKDIVWGKTDGTAWTDARTFSPINNEALTEFNGGGNVIAQLQIADRTADNLGLFGSFNGGELKKIRLETIQIKDGVSAMTTGALVGTASGTTVTNCQVYATAAQLSDCSISAANTVGGLIGQAKDCTIQTSSASLPSMESTNGTVGGLIGTLSGGSVSQCYADSGYRQDQVWQGGIQSAHTAGGLVGSVLSDPEFKNCYSVGYLASGTSAGGFVGAGSGTYKNCYSAVTFADSVKGSGFAPNGREENCYYLSGTEGIGVPVGFDALSRAFDGNSAWSDATDQTTVPYGCTETIYPLRKLTGVKQYGDWPEEQGSDQSGHGLVYYEEYQDGSYGLFYPNSDGTTSSTLKGDGGEGNTIVEAGYGALLDQGEQIGDYVLKVGNTEDKTWLKDTKAINLLGGKVLYPFNEAAIEKYMAAGNGGIKKQYFGKKNALTEYRVYVHFGASIALGGNQQLGTVDFPFQLRTQKQLANLKTNTPTYTYYWQQTRNIHVLDWTSVKPNIYGGSTIDGKGHLITGLNQPLFSQLDNGNVLQNIQIQEADIEIKNTDAGFYGVLINSLNDGKIINCSVTNSSISAESGTVAGLVGRSTNTNGRITNSKTTATVTGPNAAGFIGSNFATITDCHATSMVKGTDSAAGFVLTHTKGNITQCYASSGKISEPSVYSEGQSAGFALTSLLNSNDGFYISDSYANHSVYGKTAAGFSIAAKHLSNCYALLHVVGTEQAAGFMLKPAQTDSWAKNTCTNCYSALSTLSGGTTYGFSPKGNRLTVTNCYYLEQPGVQTENVEGTPLSYQELSELLTGDTTYAAAWTTATPGTSHPVSQALQGKAYPFPRIAALDHYGDWPLMQLTGAHLAYYEVYLDQEKNNNKYSIAFQCEELELDTLVQDTLNGNKTIVTDGYAVLFEDQTTLGDCTYNSTQSFSTLPTLIGALDANKLTLEGGGNQGNIVANDKGFEIKRDGKTEAYYPGLLNASTVVTSKPANNSFYQKLTVTADSGLSRSFWYNPHFAKSQVIDGGVTAPGKPETVSIRTERHLAELSQNSGYCTMELKFVQERDLCIAPIGSEKYATPYRKTYLSNSIDEKYCRVSSLIGTNSNQFNGTYDGKRHTISGRIYTGQGNNQTVTGVGLFGYAQNATFENLTLQGFSLTFATQTLDRVGALVGSGTNLTLNNITVKDSTVEGRAMVGGVVGYLNGGTATEVTVGAAEEETTVKVEGTRLVGGAFGQLVSKDGQIQLDGIRIAETDITSRGNENKTGEVTYGTGGVAGAVHLDINSNSEDRYHTEIQNVTVEDTEVTLEKQTVQTNYAGGMVVGNVYSEWGVPIFSLGQVTIEDCQLKGEAFGENAWYGGLIGRLCARGGYKLGAVETDDFEIEIESDDKDEAPGTSVGGIIGIIQPSTAQSLTLTLTADMALDIEVEAEAGGAYVGGFAGQIGVNKDKTISIIKGGDKGVTLKNPEVKDKADTGAAGGFVGLCDGKVEKISVQSPKVETKGGAAGGFAGKLTGEAQNCDVRSKAFNSGKVSGESQAAQVGGFAGWAEGATVKNCFAAVNVTGGSDLGGFVGYAKDSSFEKVYASGKVNGAKQNGDLGGFVGDADSSAFVSCYASGDVTCTATPQNGGGFVGRLKDGSVLGCYSAGTVDRGFNKVNQTDKQDTVGGFVGDSSLAGAAFPTKEQQTQIADFYKMLTKVKVVNRIDSHADKDPNAGDGWTFTEASLKGTKTVWKYLEDKKNLDADSGVVANAIDNQGNVTDEAILGKWDGNGKFVTDGAGERGALAYNLYLALKEYDAEEDHKGWYPLASSIWRISWDTTENQPAIYWTTTTLTENTKSVTVFRYSDKSKFTVGRCVVGKKTQFGYTYFVLGAFSDQHQLPLAVYHYETGGKNEEYNDYIRFRGSIDRWMTEQFKAEDQKAENQKSLPGMKLFSESHYPFPKLPNVGSGVTEYLHYIPDQEKAQRRRRL